LFSDARMPTRICLKRCNRAAALLCLLGAGALAGCSMSDGVGSFLIDPGHYSVYHCKDLVGRLKGLEAREKELSNLMEQASAGPGGGVIGSFAYRPDYENAVAEEKVLRRTAAEKNCELPPPLSAPSPAPAAYSLQATPPVLAPAPVFQSDQTIR
jgi:hypothetical protein